MRRKFFIGQWKTSLGLKTALARNFETDFDWSQDKTSKLTPLWKMWIFFCSTCCMIMILFHRKEQSQTDLLHTLNVVTWCIEIFLVENEKKFRHESWNSQKFRQAFCIISSQNSKNWLPLWKIQIFFVLRVVWS